MFVKRTIAVVFAIMAFWYVMVPGAIFDPIAILVSLLAAAMAFLGTLMAARIIEQAFYLLQRPVRFSVRPGDVMVLRGRLAYEARRMSRSARR